MEKIKKTDSRQNFWKLKSLQELTPQEWESLCDGCGICCLLKIEYIDTGETCYTNVACKLLNSNTCRCSHYQNRKKLLPECTVITPENLKELFWLPLTCAYRRLYEGKELEWWHPLICGDPEMVHRLGISVRQKVICETYVKHRHLENHIIDCIKVTE